MGTSKQTPDANRQDLFPLTRWSLVQSLGRDEPGTRIMLDELCHKYRQPVYAFILSRVASHEDAEDITQEYFADLLSRDYLARADQARGKFRAFLVHDLKLFLLRHRQKNQRAKRGGHLGKISLDDHPAAGDEAGASVQEPLFDREWALQTMQNARERLRTQYEAKNKSELFRRLMHGLVQNVTDADYTQWGLDLHMTPGSLKTALNRLRNQFRQILREEIAATLGPDDDLDEEMRYLHRLLLHVS